MLHQEEIGVNVDNFGFVSYALVGCGRSGTPPFRKWKQNLTTSLAIKHVLRRKGEPTAFGKRQVPDPLPGLKFFPADLDTSSSSEWRVCLSNDSLFANRKFKKYCRCNKLLISAFASQRLTKGTTKCFFPLLFFTEPPFYNGTVAFVSAFSKLINRFLSTFSVCAVAKATVPLWERVYVSPNKLSVINKCRTRCGSRRNLIESSLSLRSIATHAYAQP